MALVRGPLMTEKKKAAIRRMQQASHGPSTAKGRERIRNSHLKHGFYSKSEEVALRALGEDPAEFLKVLEGLRETLLCSNDAQDALVSCLARSLWWVKRTDRIREGNTLRRAKQADEGRERRLHAQMMSLQMNTNSLRALAGTVARPPYVATQENIDSMKSLLKAGMMKEMGELALSLMYQLRAPGLAGPDGPEAMSPEEQQRHVLQRIKEIFGVEGEPEPVEAAGSGASTPEDTSEMWAESEPVRQLLENILKEEVRICEARHDAMLKELVAGPTQFERAAEITPTQEYVTLMQRIQDSSLRQASRLLDLIGKMKRFETRFGEDL